jgi:tryptophanyl-tRNA synthetase
MMLLKKYRGDENVGVALFTYLVLMASDMLLYHTNY